MYFYNESLSLRLGSSPPSHPPQPPSFFMLFGPVCPPTPKIISPKACQTTQDERRQITTKAIICATGHNYFGFVSFVAFLPHPCPQPPGLARVMYDDRMHGWQIECLSFQGKNNLCSAKKFSSYALASCGVRPWEAPWKHTGGSLNSHALEFRNGWIF
jgi:hypothetical protein